MQDYKVSEQDDKAFQKLDWIKKVKTIFTIGSISGIAAILGHVTPIWFDYSKSIEDRLTQARHQILSAESEERSHGVTAMANILQAAPRKQWEIVETLQISLHKHAPVGKELNKTKKELPPPDVKEAINIIKNREPKNDNNGKNQQEERIINLAGLNLYGTDLQNAQLPKCSLNGSDLTNVSLGKANLEKAYLIKTYFLGAGLYKTNLAEAHLNGATLRAAKLIEANLAKANLVGTDLRKSNLEGANLEKANLEKANLEGANLKGANLVGANFTNQQIKKAHNWHLAKYEPGRWEKLKRN
jgi:hypothetical protein